MPRPDAWPIRWRLTALNVAVLAATLLGLGGFSLLQLRGALVGIAADHLHDQARPVLQRELGPRPTPPPKPDGKAAKPPPRPDGASFNLDRAANAFLRELAGRDTGVLVFDRDGAVVAASPAGEDIEGWPLPPPDQLARALAGEDGMSVAPQQTRRTLVLLLPLRLPDGAVVGVLGLANSLDLVDQLEGRLRGSLILGAGLAVVVAAALGVRATRAALRPLDRMVLATRRIGAGRLEERLRFARRDEIGELAAAFDRMLDRLEEAFAAQRRFVADAAHELRTPLTALGGMVEMLRLGADRGDEATARRMLATMGREVDRLSRLVEDLLALSRLDGASPLSAGSVALAPLVEEVVQHGRVLARGQEVRSRIEAAPVIQGDVDRLEQVFLNLLDNALTFTPTGGRVEVALAEDAGVARISVRDTGSGIAPGDLPRVFDRFYRGDKSRSRRAGGAGLGLAIARGIVEAHRGTIEATSVPDEGTTVTVTLPLAADASSDGAAQGRPSANLQVPRPGDSGWACRLDTGEGRRHPWRTSKEES